MRRMRNILVHVCRQLCTSSVHEKSRLIPIFYAQSKQKKEKEQRELHDVHDVGAKLL